MSTKVLEFFQDFKYNGRYVNVEISENPGGGRSVNLKGEDFDRNFQIWKSKR